MSLIEPDLTPIRGARLIVNSLYDTADPDFLTQSLMLVELPNRTFIDVSWVPEHDPAGRYRIAAMRGGQELRAAEAGNAHEAARCVEMMADGTN